MHLKGRGMNRNLRLALIAGMGLPTLAFAAPALGKYEPRIQAHTSPNAVTVEASLAPDLTNTDNDDATAAVIFYAPAGVTANLGQAVGTTIGNAAAVAAIGAAGGAQANLQGPVVVGDGTNATIQGFALACTGVVSHDAVWVLRVALEGQAPLDVPAFVDRTTGAEAAFSSYRIRICFRSPYVPPEQGGQPLGVKPLVAALTLTGVFSYPTAGGTLRWTGVFVPYAVGTKNPNPLAAAESQSLVDLPVRLTLTGKLVVRTTRVGRGKKSRRVKRYYAQIRGQVRTGDSPRRGATYALNGGRFKVAEGTTNANGAFTKLIRIKRTTTFRAGAVDVRTIVPTGTCTPLIPISVSPLITPTCTGLTNAGFTGIQSNRVTVRVPKR
jgi:hypothetical protein